jgi:hypothetical protein
MTMFNYLFPIFAFGLVITGVVFLGLQQASDLAKDLAVQNKTGPETRNSDLVPPDNRIPARPPTGQLTKQ